MRKITLTSALALLMGMGAMAQTTIKQSVLTEDYETMASDNHGWDTYTTTVTVETEEATGNKFLQVVNKHASNPRPSFKAWKSLDEELGGIENWGVEFDMLLEYDKKKNYGGFFLMGTKGGTKNNNLPKNTTSYVVLRQIAANDSVYNVLYSYANAKYDTLGTVVIDPALYYHYELAVEGEKATFTITDKNSSVEAFNKTYDIQMDSVGLFRQIQVHPGTNGGKIQLDNLNVYKVVSLDHVEVPTAEISFVYGTERDITLACVTPGVTLDYIISNRVYDEVNDTAYYEPFSDWIAYGSRPITIANNVKLLVRATKGSVSAESDTLKFDAGTEIALNPVTIKSPVFDPATQSYTATLSTTTSSILCNPDALIIWTMGGETKEVVNNTTITVPVGQEFTAYAEAIGYVNSDTLTGTALAPYSRMAADRIEVATYMTIDGYSGYTGFGEVLFSQQINDTLTYDVQEIVVGLDTITGENIVLPETRIGLVDIAYTHGNTQHGWTFNSSALRCLYENGYVGVCGLKKGQMIEIYGTNMAPVAMNDVAVADNFHAANGYFEFRVEKDGDFLFETGKTANTGPRLNYITIYDTKMTTSADLKGWSVYYNPTDSVELPIEVQAYTVEEDTVNNGVINLTLIQDGVVPVATPVLIKAKSGVAFNPVPATASATSNFDVHSTQLYGVSGRTKVTDSKARYEYYTLGLDTEGNICMVRDSIPVVDAFSGYFRTTKEDHLAKDSSWVAPEKYTFSFLPGQEPIYYPEDGEVGEKPGEGIQLNQYQAEEAEAIYYDLMGRRVTALKKGGIYILKGKKILVK